VPEKKGCLGCSFPVIVGVLLVFLVLFVVGFAVGPLGKSVFGDLGLPSWLTVDQPHPELPAEVVFHLFGFPITNSVIGVATIFLFVALNTWLSLLPGFGSITVETAEGEVHLLRGANTDINMPLALALMSFVFVEFFGLRSHGFRYLGKFVNVGQFFRSIGQLFRGRLRAGLNGLITGAINIFVGFLEALSELVRIVSFTFRLFGNMTAGEILLLMAMFLIPWLFALPFYGLELLVGFVQALIFSGLTLVFLTVAVASHGGEAA
jgi:F-type H+-transporting ATPase subunit a